MFTMNPTTGDVSINTNTKVILFAIKNLVLTNYYERLFHSELGSPVAQLLFDLNNNFQFSLLVKRTILDLLEEYEPRVTVTDVEVNDSPDYNKVFIKISANIKNTQLPITANIILERTR